jgi:hypothetical protein
MTGCKFTSIIIVFRNAMPITAAVAITITIFVMMGHCTCRYIFNGPVINQSRLLDYQISGTLSSQPWQHENMFSTRDSNSFVDNETIRTGSLTGTMIRVINDKRQEGSFCRYINDDYTDCEIKGAVNYDAGPVTVQFQTDGSNYNGTTRFNQDFFGFRAYYFTGSDATNLMAMGMAGAGGSGKLLAGRIDDIFLQSVKDTLDEVAGTSHEFTFLCPVRNYSVYSCARDVPCNPSCPSALSLTCCGGFCVPVDDYGDPFPTVHEIVMVKPEILYRMNPAISSDWTSTDTVVVERLRNGGQYTQRFNLNSSLANASLEVDLKSPLLMFHKNDLQVAPWRKNMTESLCREHGMCELNPAIQFYSSLIDSIRASNITVRKCKFAVTSIRAGVMTASMRFEYKERRRWPYDSSLPTLYEESYLLQPLEVQPNRCVAIGSSITLIAAGSFSTFTVYTRDKYSNPRILGGEVVNALLISKNYNTPQQLAADVVNNGNGTYFVEYLLTRTGNYFLAINVVPLGQTAPKLVNELLSSQYNVRASPISVFVMSGPINVETINIMGNMQSGVAGYYLMHVVRIYDVYGNLASPDVAGRLSVRVVHSANTVPYQSPRTPSRFAAADIDALPEGPGDFLLSWMPVMTGWYMMSILLYRSNVNVHINNSPFSIYVLPSPIDALSSESKGALFETSVLTVSERIFGIIKLRDAFGNFRKELEVINNKRFAMSFNGIEISDCPYIQNLTLLETLKACPSIFDGNMTISRRCTSSNYLASNTNPSLVKAYTLNGNIDHTLDRHDKLKAWLANTIRFNSCNQIARIATDTASQLPRAVSPERWKTVPPRHEIATLVNTSRKMDVTALASENGDPILGVAVACTAAGLYRVAVSFSQEFIQGLPHFILVQAGSAEASASRVFGSLVNKDQNDRPVHSGFVRATDLYEVSVFLRDRFGNFVWTGQPGIFVSLEELHGYRCPPTGSCFPFTRLPSSKVKTAYSYHKLIDTNDGAYTVIVTLPIPGQFDVNVFLTMGLSKTLIGQSPYIVDVSSGLYALENTVVDGQGAISCGAGVICSYSVFHRDKFKNMIVLHSGITFALHSCPKQQCNITNDKFNALVELYKLDDSAHVPLMLSSANLKVTSETGKASISYEIKEAGQYSWSISSWGMPVPGSPYRFSIFGGITFPLTTIVSGYGLECVHPGFPSTFVIRTRDQFSNFKTAGGDIVEARHLCSISNHIPSLTNFLFASGSSSRGSTSCVQRFRHWSWTVRHFMSRLCPYLLPITLDTSFPILLDASIVAWSTAVYI